MKKIFMMIVGLIMFVASTVQAAEPSIIASSAILVEASTGRVIYEKNADELRQPASLTKMMTCIIGIENLSPETEIKIQPLASSAEYSDLNLQTGDVITARELIKGTLLVSDNGGAIAVAEEISKTVPSFVEIMNNKARIIGCEHTHFANPNGLPNKNNVTTARDLAKIAIYCMQDRKFREYVLTQKSTVRWVKPYDLSATFENTNDLLKNYDGITGIKTGYTRDAGGCVAASARRNGVELIAIVLNSSDYITRFDDAAKLLDYGFETLKSVYPIKKSRAEKVAFVRGGENATVKVGLKEDLKFPLLNDEDSTNLTLTYENLPVFIDAGIKSGDIIGEAVLKYEGKQVATLPMIALENVDEGFSLGSVIVKVTEPLFTIAQSFFGEEKLAI